jgi:transposase
MVSQSSSISIGIDAAVVASHRVAVRGQQVEDFSVSPTLDGLGELTQRLAVHAPALAVAEPTGMSWLSLGHAVRDAGCQFALVEARHSAKLRGALAGKNKTDVIDAHMLAGCAELFGLAPATLPGPGQLALRRAVRRRHRAVVQAHGAECRLWALAAWAFPDVWRACKGSQRLAQALLRRWPHLEGLAHARLDSIAAVCVEHLRQPGDPHRRATRIRDAARGWAQFWAGRIDLDALAWEVGELLADISAADAKIARATRRAVSAWKATWGSDELLCSLPGIGPIIAPVVRAWLGEATQFPSGKQAAAFVGLNPSNWESGLMASPSRPITKEGPQSCAWPCTRQPTSRAGTTRNLPPSISG